MLSTEWGLIIKNHEVYTGEPFPTWIKISWVIIGIVLTAGLVIVWKRQTKDETEEWNPYDPKINIKLHKSKRS
jgi:hypothetical protein